LRVLTIFNEQREFGGEELAVRSTVELLRSRGIETEVLGASSRDLSDNLTDKVRAAASGVYNVSAYRRAAAVVRSFDPDVVHAHNVYPMLSPSVLAACRREGYPVVFTVHSQMLTCPTWYNVYNGTICERCFGGGEYACVVQNCRGNIPESIAYAARSASARKFGLFARNVHVIVVGSEFMRERLQRAGYAGNRIAILRNSVGLPDNPREGEGDLVLFVGRLSPEKGVSVLLEAARSVPDIPITIVGTGPDAEALARNSPPNVHFEGFVDHAALGRLYRRARVLVVPSVTFETNGPYVALEAMAHGVPVVGSSIGALPETVAAGETGLLFEPGDAAELTRRLRSVWSNPVESAEMGAKARKRVIDRYTVDHFFDALMEIYAEAREIAHG
jgi:glycosyltransferase involved in cell wall biosynthesis